MIANHAGRRGARGVTLDEEPARHQRLHLLLQSLRELLRVTSSELDVIPQHTVVVPSSDLPIRHLAGVVHDVEAQNGGHSTEAEIDERRGLATLGRGQDDTKFTPAQPPI